MDKFWTGLAENLGLVARMRVQQEYRSKFFQFFKDTFDKNKK